MTQVAETKEIRVDELKPCPFCGGPMQLRFALWPSEGDRDAVIHNVPGGTSCPIEGAFSIDTFDNGVSVAEAWNRRAPDKPSEAVAWVVDGRLRDGTPIMYLPFLTSREDMERYQRANPDVKLKALYDRPLFTSSEVGSEVDQFIAAAKLLEDAGWKISRPTQPAESAKSGDGE